MFSGGLDSTILATILCGVLDADYQVDLVNVSFDAKTSADRITAIFSYHELLKLHPGKKLRLICADYNIGEVMDNEQGFLTLLQPKTSHMDFNIGCALHFASRGEGYLFDTAFYLSPYFTEIQ
jgi:asparagine synthetase B (glutamine-hydrolysing)